MQGQVQALGLQIFPCGTADVCAEFAVQRAAGKVESAGEAGHADFPSLPQFPPGPRTMRAV